nr:riboflavin biosynthesis protein RibF [Clostridia bacterium]
MTTQKTVIALGNFDGVHIGHALLLRTAVETAERLGALPTVWTFERHSFSPPYITDSRERALLFEKNGISHAHFADFEALRSYSPERFVDEELIGRHSCAAVVCGFNFRFGQGGSGTADTMRLLCEKRGLECIVCGAVEYGASPVSSTRIREALTLGDTEAVHAMLGRHHSFELPVVGGRKVGRSIGMPTMNQHFPEGMLIPRHGVYAGFVTLDGKRQACVTNIGTRPTFGDSEALTCESHLLDYRGDLYDMNLRLTLVKFLRPEMKFESPTQLVEQIERDIEQCRRIEADA